MRLSWSEIKSRAKAFSVEWKDAHYERGETQSFYNDFFEIFGVKRRQVAIYEKRVEIIERNKRGFIDLFWPGTLIIEQKSAGRDLLAARSQAFDYFDGLKEIDQPKYVLACDFQRFRLLDLDTRRETDFTLSELHKHVEAFAFILGRPRSFGTQAAVNIKAAELMGRLHDALEASGYLGHDLEQLLVRLLFCLFADDTGIFEPKDIFLNLIEERTADDGNDVGRWLNDLFDTLDTDETDRQSTLDPELMSFPHVNGALFAGRLRTPHFDATMRSQLLDAARFDWSKVSPAIFGSLFQSVMDADERRRKGAHYTSETNIRKVIDPLFLDDLKAEFARIKNRKMGRRAALQEFQRKLRRLTFLDPACGCGNFLVVAYRELRALELEVLKELYAGETVLTGLDSALLSQVNVDQFYGIEFEEFPARIAEVAMWMTDHLANSDFNEAFGANQARIPLKQSAHIRHADALEIDWNDVLPAVKCSYVLGNPPFVGSKYQSDVQRAQVRRIAALGGTGGTLDYVAAWFIRSGAYLAVNRRIRVGFVATNSITQGEQVAQLWPILFDRHRLEIGFAHRTFVWDSEARGKAHVHVVIIGLAHRDAEPKTKRLFSYSHLRGQPVETSHDCLTAYLFDASEADRHLVVQSRADPLSANKRLVIGSKPVDGGHYIFTHAERAEFLESEPGAANLLHPYVGAEEFLHGGERWILALHDASPTELRQLPSVVERIRRVRAFREASRSTPTRLLAATAQLYHVNVIPAASYLVIPKVSSERREYVPIGWLNPPTIPSDLVFVLQDADLYDFAVLTSSMHMAWLRHMGGRLKSDYRYSIGLVYNTFPWPDVTLTQKKRLEVLAEAVLSARGLPKNAASTLADLYDPDRMPVELHRVHKALDAAVDQLYSTKQFLEDRARIEHLFGRYERLVAPMTALAGQGQRNSRRRKGVSAPGVSVAA